MNKKIILVYKSGVGPYALNALIARAFENINYEVIPANSGVLCEEEFTNIIMAHKDADFLLECGRGCMCTDLYKQLRIPTVLWMPTIISTSIHSRKLVATKGINYDIVYTSIVSEKSIYKEYNVDAKILFTAADLSYTYPISLKKDIDLSLLGNPQYGSRKNFIKFIKNKYNIYQEFSYHKYTENINRTKININIGMLKNGIPRRVFEILACGGFLLCYEYSDKEEQIFEDKKHLVYFNENNIEELIDYYLNHEEERKVIGEQGRQEVLKKHTFHHRVLKIIEDVKQWEIQKEK